MIKPFIFLKEELEKIRFFSDRVTINLNGKIKYTGPPIGLNPKMTLMDLREFLKNHVEINKK